MPASHAGELIAQSDRAYRVLETHHAPTYYLPVDDMLATFYAVNVNEAWVDDVKVIPQPGDFYGGWVTPNLEGRIKGAPGTNHW